jgi:hypothetical protein
MFGLEKTVTVIRPSRLTLTVISKEEDGLAMGNNVPVPVDQIPTAIKVSGCLLYLLVLPSTREAALSVLFLLPFAAIIILVSAWIFGRIGMIVSAAFSILIMAAIALNLLSFL